GSESRPMVVKLGYNAEQQPRYYSEEEATLKGGEKRGFVYRQAFFTPENYPAIGEIKVTDVEGAVYYHRDVKWMTQPADPWDRVAAKSKDEAFEFDIAWYPTPQILKWKIDFASFEHRDKVTELCIRTYAEKDEELYLEYRHYSGAFKNYGAEGKMELNFSRDGWIADEWGNSRLDGWEDGRYRLDLYAITGDEEADAVPVKSAVFEHRTDFAWLGNDIGKSDVVIPPFTPMVVKGDIIETVLRSHKMGAFGLWDQVTAAGEDILASPMRLEVKSGGETFTAEGVGGVASAKEHEVVTEAEWTAGPVKGRVHGVMEYDGCLRMDVTLEGIMPTTLNPQFSAPLVSVDAVDLVIPLRNDQASLMHACGDGLRINYGGFVPEGEGEVWSSIRASRSDLLGTFLPYLWVGNDDRGFCWFAASDKGWVLDLTNKTPALALERDGETLTLRVRLVQKSVALAGTKRTISFGMMATPAKPMPEGWRKAGLFHGGKVNTTFLGMCMYWGGLLYSVFPMERDFTVVEKIVAANRGERDNDFFEAYIAKYPQVAAEVRWSGALRNSDFIVPYTNIRGEVTFTPEWRVYQDEWRRGDFGWRETRTNLTEGAIDFSLIPVPSRIDYLLYHYREFLRAGLDGIYWDNICTYASQNRVMGDGYVREDGSYQPEADIWRLRDVTRRTAVLAHEMGKPNVNMPHMTNAALVPVFSWTGYYLGWEWKYGPSDWQDRFSRGYIRAINTGRSAGNIPGVLEGQTGNVQPDEKRQWVLRTRAGVVLTHEIIVQMPDALLTSLKNILFDIGYGDTAEVFNYWEKNPVLNVEGLDSSWLAVKGNGKVALILCDWGDGAPSVTVTPDMARLGLKAGYAATHAETQETVKADGDGRLVLPGIARHDFAMWILEN
ncbi:MAG: DUF6067 family protein, partial [Kiritimatiellaeota bacterium]|nr:DUF6067 family protein [Kiritimatiellota bacterium]